jgi:hypothetical protein
MARSCAAPKLCVLAAGLPVAIECGGLGGGAEDSDAGPDTGTGGGGGFTFGCCTRFDPADDNVGAATGLAIGGLPLSDVTETEADGGGGAGAGANLRCCGEEGDGDGLAPPGVREGVEFCKTKLKLTIGEERDENSGMGLCTCTALRGYSRLMSGITAGKTDSK